jgi:hypothetical protein
MNFIAGPNKVKTDHFSTPSFPPSLKHEVRATTCWTLFVKLTALTFSHRKVKAFELEDGCLSGTDELTIFKSFVYSA